MGNPTGLLQDKSLTTVFRRDLRDLVDFFLDGIYGI